MSGKILLETDFQRPCDAWEWPARIDQEWEPTGAGLILSAPGRRKIVLDGVGVHTRNGDSIELEFRLLKKKTGSLTFGFSGGFEFATIKLDFRNERVALYTSDWSIPQPVASSLFSLGREQTHRLVLEKSEAGGRLVKNANIEVHLDGKRVLRAEDLNILPEIGVTLTARETRILLLRFVQRGEPSLVAEYLHIGGWQMPNQSSISANLDSIFRGLREASEKGIQLLVTPETSLTGLFPAHSVNRKEEPIAEAEKKLKAFIQKLKNAPYLVVGFPVWERVAAHQRRKTRYNVSRVYDPDGGIVATCPKVHSCETEFWHGYRYNEFEVYHVPVSLHICHDGRYPDLWTVPIMFGARLVLLPANGARVDALSIDAFESQAKMATGTAHTFCIYVNGGGGSYLVSPKRKNNLIAVSQECGRDSPTFPLIGEPREGLFSARIRVHDAFGYWPVRAFRRSEAVAEAYLSLYRAMGGRTRLPSVQ